MTATRAAALAPSSAQLLALLKEQFGYEAFRPGQERVIRDLLAGRDALAVLPTGAGKSLVFQLAAQLLPGVTLVVSPLLALMKDQADAVTSHGLDVGVVNSAQSAGQVDGAIEKAKCGEAKLLYVTPERFEDEEFLADARRMEISLFVVDEAHCVSEWGYDFRPSYLRLGDAARRLGRPTMLAATATATPWVRRDIIDRLGLRHPDVVVHDVDRPNLFLEVIGIEKEEEDYRRLRELMLDEPRDYPPETAVRLRGAMQGSGIIYTATTRAARETARWLREWGIAADFYHGQRSKGERERVQEAFMAGELRVIAATNAFGLGVDKPDVRFVIHREVPASVEEYYQEAGRAGRDGEFARAALLYRPAELGRAAFLASTSRLRAEDLAQVRAALAGSEAVPLAALQAHSGLSKPKLTRVLDLLKREGLAQEGAGKICLRREFDPAEVSLEGEERRHAYERSRLGMMRHYAELWECRRGYLLNYFGEEAPSARCGMCDNDVSEARHSSCEGDGNRPPFERGQRVRHAAWGDGEVTEVDEATVTVAFDGEKRRLALDAVLKEKLLERLPHPAGGADNGDGECREVAEPDGFAIGECVVHRDYGVGEVQRVAGDSLIVLFEEVGYRQLATAFVREKGLLKALAGVEEEAADQPRPIP